MNGHQENKMTTRKLDRESLEACLGRVIWSIKASEERIAKLEDSAKTAETPEIRATLKAKEEELGILRRRKIYYEESLKKTKR